MANPTRSKTDLVQKILNMPLAYSVASGRFDAMGVNKFGRSTNVDSATDTDIYDKTDQAIWLPPTDARIHAVVSTSTSDALLGVGAREVQLYGLNSWDSVETSEVIELDGTTPVNTANEYVIVHRIKVIESGATAINVGVITATAAVDGTVTAQINIGEGQTQMSIYGIPSIKAAYMTAYYSSAIKSSSSLAVKITLLVNTNPNVQLLNYLTKHTIGLATEGSNYVKHSFNPLFKIQGPAIIKIQGNSSTDNTDVSAGFDLILEDL